MAKQKEGFNYKLIVMLTAAYFLLMRGVTAVSDQLSFGRPRVKITGATVSGIKLTLNMPVTNNNSFPLFLDYFNGALMYGTYHMAAINITGPVEFPAQQVKNLTVQLFVPYQSAAGNIFDMVQNGTWWQSFFVGGTAGIKGVAFNVPPIGIQIL